jgi:hypothetical protein
VINSTADEVIQSQVIDKAADVLKTFLKSGLEEIKDLTKEKQQPQAVSPGACQTPGADGP